MRKGAGVLLGQLGTRAVDLTGKERDHIDQIDDQRGGHRRRVGSTPTVLCGCNSRSLGAPDRRRLRT